MLSVRAAASFLVMLAGGWVPSESARAESYTPRMGEIHPQIVLPAADGSGPVALSSFRGKKVLLVHFASWSEDCRRRLPAWIERTRSLVDSNKLVVVAVTQEQYADRAILLAQWLNLNWVILHDQLNLLGVRELPSCVAIDEHGVVRDTNPRPDNVAEAFVFKNHAEPKKPPPEPATTELPDPRITRRIAGEGRTAGPWRDHGDALVLAGLPPQIDEAIEAYEKAVSLDRADAASAFRLGVARRIRYDRPERQENDFQEAVTAWQRAVKADPKHTVYQGRLRAYGPAVDRKFSFYGWVAEARAAITASGRAPTPLAVEPSPAETARPASEFKIGSRQVPEGDRSGSVRTDDRNLVRVTQAVVRGTEKRNQTIAEVHLVFTPDAGRRVRWSNRNEPLRVWIQRPQIGRLAEEYVNLPNPPEAESTEQRTINFSIRLPSTKKGVLTLKAYALYRVVGGDESGEGRLLRRDLEIRIPL